jgi:hypothetical protein
MTETIAPTDDADEFVARMVAEHEDGGIRVDAGRLTSAEARALAERLLADADRVDGRRFEIVGEPEWDPQP